MTIDLVRQLEKLEEQPIPHQVVLALLKDYSNPNEKIRQLINRQLLQPVRRGLYVAGPQLGNRRPEPMLLANHIAGPSYVTAETALSFHGLIPERVYMMVSATPGKSRSFDTKVGMFQYHQLRLPYYSFGILSVQLREKQFVMIASPVKAIFDRVIFTPYLRLRSTVQALHLLVDDWRMEEDMLRKLDVVQAREWLNDAPKSNSLDFIIQAIRQL
ncbi:MAG: hypothetical protein JNK79_02175 [Chitinophagaceae bacterium]|nr:hypothetical protein [Chitinophagaceae bacterium]